mgnify:CR=1 FL=1|jgi:hypothetical protein
MTAKIRDCCQKVSKSDCTSLFASDGGARVGTLAVRSGFIARNMLHSVDMLNPAVSWNSGALDCSSRSFLPSTTTSTL